MNALQAVELARLHRSPVVDGGLERGVGLVDDARDAACRRRPRTTTYQSPPPAPASRNCSRDRGRRRRDGRRLLREALLAGRRQVEEARQRLRADVVRLPVGRRQRRADRAHAGRHARQDHAVAERREHLVPVRVLDGMAGDLGVARERLVLRRGCRRGAARRSPRCSPSRGSTTTRGRPPDRRGTPSPSRAPRRRGRRGTSGWAAASRPSRAPRAAARTRCARSHASAASSVGCGGPSVAHQREVALPVRELAVDRVACPVPARRGSRARAARQSSAWTRASASTPFHQMRARRSGCASWTQPNTWYDGTSDGTSPSTASIT